MYDVGESHPVGAENSGVLVDVDGVHAEGTRDGAGMLAPSTSEASKNMITSV